MAGLLLTFVFALVELSGGWFFGSLALMSDSGHMFSDSAALLVAVIAARVALKPPGGRHSYGFARAEIIAASFNGLLLLAIVVFIVVEAIERLQDPQPVSGLGVLVVAFFGLLINITVLRMLGHGEQAACRYPPRISFAFQHLMTDLQLLNPMPGVIFSIRRHFILTRIIVDLIVRIGVTSRHQGIRRKIRLRCLEIVISLRILSRPHRLAELPTVNIILPAA